MQRIGWVVDELIDLFGQYPDLTYTDIRAYNAAGWRIERANNVEVVNTVVCLTRSDLWEAAAIAHRLTGRAFPYLSFEY
jgi:hypothetical protein